MGYIGDTVYSIQYGGAVISTVHNTSAKDKTQTQLTHTFMKEIIHDIIPITEHILHFLEWIPTNNSWFVIILLLVVSSITTTTTTTTTILLISFIDVV